MSLPEPVRVLVVEDELVAAQAHVAYVRRVPGFAVTAMVHSGAAAIRALGSSAVDLVLLDMQLPDQHGLDVVRTMRAARHPADVVAVTSARDLSVVRAAVSLGVVQYLLKPFTFAALRDKLERYAEFREQIGSADVAVGQAEVDRALSSLRGSDSASALPKGLTSATLDAVVAAVRAAPGGMSAAETADCVGASRVTVRRYLEHLADNMLVARSPRYGAPGRPEVAYRWLRTR